MTDSATDLNMLHANYLQEGMRADGATEEQIKHFEVRQTAERELRAAEAECSRQRMQGGVLSQEALARLEEAEQALDVVLNEDLEGFCGE